MKQDDYIAAVDWLEQQRPDHPLLAALKRQYSKINVIYLNRILREVGPPQARVQSADEPEPTYNALDPDYVALQQRLSNLYAYRAKLSNSLHDCRSDQQRAMVSNDIQQTQSDIATLRRRKRHFERTGQMPMIDEPEEAPLPEGVDLIRAYNANCKRRMYLESKLKEAASTQDPVKLKKVPEWEQKLKNERREFDRLKAARDGATV